MTMLVRSAISRYEWEAPREASFWYVPRKREKKVMKFQCTMVDQTNERKNLPRMR